MNDANSLKKQLIQLRERMLNQKYIDAALINQYNLLELQYKTSSPQVSFDRYPSITQLSRLERFGNVELAYESRINPILNRLEYMISNFPEDTIEEELIFFWKMTDKNIIVVSKKLFDGGHYADSVLAAFKEVNNRVKHIVWSYRCANDRYSS